jgi:hypothetical protein
MDVVERIIMYLLPICSGDISGDTTNKIKQFEQTLNSLILVHNRLEAEQAIIEKAKIKQSQDNIIVVNADIHSPPNDKEINRLASESNILETTPLLAKFNEVATTPSTSPATPSSTSNSSNPSGSVNNSSKKKKQKFISFDQFELMVKKSEDMKVAAAVESSNKSKDWKGWSVDDRGNSPIVSITSIQQQQNQKDSKVADNNASYLASNGFAAPQTVQTIVPANSLSSFLPEQLRNPNQKRSPLAVTSKSVSSPPTAGTSPWMKSDSSSAVTPKLSQIQQEEELDKNTSSLKELQGNHNPWYIDRRNMRVNSLEDVMRIQKDEKIEMQINQYRNSVKEVNSNKSSAKSVSKNTSKNVKKDNKKAPENKR